MILRWVASRVFKRRVITASGLFSTSPIIGAELMPSKHHRGIADLGAISTAGKRLKRSPSGHLLCEFYFVWSLFPRSWLPFFSAQNRLEGTMTCLIVCAFLLRGPCSQYFVATFPFSADQLEGGVRKRPPQFQGCARKRPPCHASPCAPRSSLGFKRTSPDTAVGTGFVTIFSSARSHRFANHVTRSSLADVYNPEHHS